MFMGQSFPNLHWLDGERVEGREGEEVKGKGCGLGEGVKKERRVLEQQLEKLAAVGNGLTEGREGVKTIHGGLILEIPFSVDLHVQFFVCADADPLIGFALNDQLAMGKITRKVSFISLILPDYIISLGI